MWFNYQIPSKIYLDYRITYQKISNTSPRKKYRIPYSCESTFSLLWNKNYYLTIPKSSFKISNNCVSAGLKPWYQLSLIKTRTNFPGLLLLSRTRHFVSISSLLLPHWQVSCLPGCRYLRHEVSREDSKPVFVYVVSNKIFQIIKTFEGVSFERTTKPSYRHIIQTSRCSEMHAFSSWWFHCHDL